MNKRIQKKIAKQSQPEIQSSDAQFSASAVRIAARPSRSVVHRQKTDHQPTLRRPRMVQAVADQATQLGANKRAVESVLEVADQVQQRTASTIKQVRDKISKTENQVREKINETEAQLKERLVETEERAEALLEKVPVVGSKAAKKLHDLTHR